MRSASIAPAVSEASVDVGDGAAGVVTMGPKSDCASLNIWRRAALRIAAARPNDVCCLALKIVATGIGVDQINAQDPGDLFRRVAPIAAWR